MRYFRPAIFAVLLGFVALPAAALELCDELWFTRNLIFDRAGYCFGSALGQVVFDNAGCTSGAPNLSPQAQQLVEYIRSEEVDWSCAVNSDGQRLAVDFQAIRMAITDIPIPSGFVSSCFGWRGPGLALRAAHDVTAAQTGMVEKGDDIIWEFERVDGWSFIISSRGNGAMGWMQEPQMDEQSCDAFGG
ncbi:MAG: DUF4453 domain-containing protein [Rhodobacteraceae bacterium]|nr:DUF4453 domain-containing protein [Paracoccaceae bacterium]